MLEFLYMIGICIFMIAFLQKRTAFLESYEYKKYINPKRESRSQKFSVWSKYLLYITLAMILLRVICILIPSGELKTRVSALPVYLSIIMMSLFVMINSQVIWYSPFHPTDSKRPDSIYNKEVTEPPFYLAVTGGMVLICSFIGTINLTIKIFKLLL